MQSDPGDEFQIVHPLHLLRVFPVAAADLAFLFIEAEAFQREPRPNHVLTHQLGLFLGLGPNTAVSWKAGVAPGENAFRPFRAQELLADKVGQDLAAEE